MLDFFVLLNLLLLNLTIMWDSHYLSSGQLNNQQRSKECNLGWLNFKTRLIFLRREKWESVLPTLNHKTSIPRSHHLSELVISRAVPSERTFFSYPKKGVISLTLRVYIIHENIVPFALGNKIIVLVLKGLLALRRFDKQRWCLCQQLYLAK